MTRDISPCHNLLTHDRSLSKSGERINPRTHSISNMSSLSMIMSHPHSITIKSNDVLLGRGGTTNKHPGNVRLRQMAALVQPHYLMARKREKRSFAVRIVETIYAEGGRFLQHESNGAWVDVPYERALNKTLQCLRENLDIGHRCVRHKKHNHQTPTNCDRRSKTTSNASPGAESWAEDDDRHDKDCHSSHRRRWRDELAGSSAILSSKTSSTEALYYPF